MNIRIIAGYYGGLKIAAPNNRRTHPMSERIRNALFNSLAGEIADAEVLDVFAGTGAIGLEAISRGAKSATFVDKDRTAQRYMPAISSRSGWGIGRPLFAQRCRIGLAPRILSCTILFLLTHHTGTRSFPQSTVYLTY